MLSGQLNNNIKAINNFKRILLGARMTEVSYGETFNLFFEQNFNHNAREIAKFVFSIDAMCWFGNRDEWLKKVNEPENADRREREDCLLAFEIVRLRYNNFIQIQRVEFYDDFFSIEFPGDNILSIAYYAESDYAWFLEEVSPQKEHERMVIGCSGNRIFHNNIPEFI